MACTVTVNKPPYFFKLNHSFVMRHTLNVVVEKDGDQLHSSCEKEDVLHIFNQGGEECPTYNEKKEG